MYQGNQFFMASDLPKFVNYDGLSLRMQYQFDLIHGISRNTLDDTEFLSVSIQKGIQSGFIVSNFLLLTLDDITVAFIDNPTCGTYSVFASLFRDVTYVVTSEGAAVLLTFALIDDLSQYILRLYPNILFN